MCGQLRHKEHASDSPRKLQIQCVPLAQLWATPRFSKTLRALSCALTPRCTPSPYSLPNRRLDLPLFFLPAQGFEEAKRALGGFHFVAVQSNPDADDVAGFWLLKEVAM